MARTLDAEVGRDDARAHARRRVPLAAVEPDGLLITTDGAYVRLLECVQPLQPLRGGREHREAIRDQLAALAARIPAGQSLQVVVEAEPLDVDAALADDWQRDRRRGTAASARSPRPRRGDAPARLRPRADVRRSAPAVQAARLRWTVAARWQPDRAGDRWRSESAARRARVHDAVAARARARRRRLAALHRRRSRRARRRRLRARALDGAQALAALARALAARRRSPPPATFAGLPRVLDTTDSDAALAHRHALVEARRRRRGARTSGATGSRTVGRGELEAVMHLSGAPADTSLWWLMGLMEVPPPWRLSVHITATDRARQRRRQRLRHKRLWADLRRRERDGKLIAAGGLRAGARGRRARRRAAADRRERHLRRRGLPRDPPPRRRGGAARRAARARWPRTSSPTPTRACTAAASSPRTPGSPRCRSPSTGSARRGGSRIATSATACRC